MAGLLLGRLLVCDPPQQTIDELGEALLENDGMARRTRTAVERMDRG